MLIWTPRNSSSVKIGPWPSPASTRVPAVVASTSWSRTDTSGRFTMALFSRSRAFPTQNARSKPPGAHPEAGG
jgi:hypothetical protein